LVTEGYATVSGGYNNTAGTACTVSGGYNNTASGDYFSTVGGGYSNTASSFYSTVSGGYNNTASNGFASTVGGGWLNTASSDYALVCGGYNNTASGKYSTVIGGGDNSATANYSTALGYKAKTTNVGQFAVGSSPGSSWATGHAQSSIYIHGTQTSDATQTTLSSYSQIESITGNRLIVPDDTTWFFNIKVVARRTDANDESAIYKFEGAIDRNSGVATTALVGTVTKTVYAEDTPAWDVTVEADTSIGALAIKVTGEAGKTIRWVARIETTEVTG